MAQVLDILNGMYYVLIMDSYIFYWYLTLNVSVST